MDWNLVVGVLSLLVSAGSLIVAIKARSKAASVERSLVMIMQKGLIMTGGTGGGGGAGPGGRAGDGGSIKINQKS